MHTKPATQLRSREKRDRILAAMDSLLKSRPFATITVTELAAAARVSPATVYQRFSNDDVLGSVLLALYFARVQEWADRSRPSTVPADLSKQLHGIAADAWDQVATLGHVMRPAYLYSRQYPQRAGKEWARLERVARDGFRAYLGAQAAQLRVADPDRAADVLCDLFNFMLLGPLLHDDSPRWQASAAREEFADALGTLAYRYLTCSH